MMLHSLLYLPVWALVLLPRCFALRQQVLSSFVFTRHGDRTPLYSDDTSILTPYGASQLHQAGSNFRDRYLTTTFDDAMGTTAIRGISHHQYNTEEIDILTTDYQYTVASAQAFLQGLYPPLQDESQPNNTTTSGISNMADGSDAVAPLNGYQYADVRTASSYDIQSVWIDGSQNCPALTGKLIEYYNTSDFDFLYTSTVDFYDKLQAGYLSSFSTDSLGYFDAYYVYDYLQYQYRHNSSFHDSISDVNMSIAEVLAADWVHAMYSNKTDEIKSIAGKSMARQILLTFYEAIQMEGRTNKLNLWFGDFAPMVSFAALAGLTSEQNEIFYNVPPFGSSYVFELVSMLPDDEPSTDFPDSTDMYVRFFYQNGTDEYSNFVAYPLFGRSPSQTLIPYSEFVAGLSQFSSNGIKEWCEMCGAYSIFCPAYTGSSSVINGGKSKRTGLSPAVAGVIGALVALVVAGILFGLLMLIAGFRVRREGGKKRPSLAGFKGSQKLASDQDLTIPKGSAGATVITTEPDAAKGHERTGSWELREQMKRKEAGELGAVTALPQRRPSYEDDEIHVDPYAQAVRPHDQV